MPTFDKEFARLLLEICRFTYASAFDGDPEAGPANAKAKQEAQNWIDANHPGGTLIMVPSPTDRTSVACIASYPDKNIVSYMGTMTEFTAPTGLAGAKDDLESLLDWAENLRLELVPFSLTGAEIGPGCSDIADIGGRVHKGFHEQLRTVQGAVVARLLELNGMTLPLFVTGHSQGGAEAALATKAFLVGGFNVAATYTFAAPRPGEADFAASIPAAQPFHRIEYGNDIVPHVPPKVISATVRAAIALVLKFPLLSDSWRRGLQLLASSDGKVVYTGAGRLCYSSSETVPLSVDLSAAEEDALFDQRLRRLLEHPGNWADHHHLAGTTAEVAAGQRGNYSALVS